MSDTFTTITQLTLNPEDPIATFPADEDAAGSAHVGTYGYCVVAAKPTVSSELAMEDVPRNEEAAGRWG
ncbi:hypothetical protein DXG03_007891, partial [Asterophora parasitica]